MKKTESHAKRPYTRPVCTSVTCEPPRLLNSSDAPYVKEEDGYISIDYRAIMFMGQEDALYGSADDAI